MGTTRRSATLALLAPSAILFFSIGAAANDRPLGLEETRRLAVARSPVMTAIMANALAQREMAVAAAQRPDPVLKLGASNVPIEGAERYSLDRDFMTMANIAITQELPSQAKRDARQTRSLREAEVADAMRAVQSAQIEREAATAWLERSFAQRARELLVRQLDEARLLLTAVEAAFRAARGPQGDIFSARGHRASSGPH